MAAWPIHLPAHTVYKHFSSQYVVLVWCDIVWAQVCLGQRGFFRITAVALRTALRPYIFHVISVKGTWCFPVPNQEGPGAGTGGHIGKLSFLNDSHCCRQTKARFWGLACGRVLRSSVRCIHHFPKKGAKCFKNLSIHGIFRIHLKAGNWYKRSDHLEQFSSSSSAILHGGSGERIEDNRYSLLTASRGGYFN